MTRRRIGKPLALLVAVALVLALLAPRPSRADTVTTVAVISSGAVAAVLIVAIIGSTLTDDDDDFLPLPLQPAGVPAPPPGREDRVRFGARCPQAADGALTFCW